MKRQSLRIMVFIIVALTYCASADAQLTHYWRDLYEDYEAIVGLRGRVEALEAKVDQLEAAASSDNLMLTLLAQMVMLNATNVMMHQTEQSLLRDMTQFKVGRFYVDALGNRVEWTEEMAAALGVQRETFLTVQDVADTWLTPINTKLDTLTLSELETLQGRIKTMVEYLVTQIDALLQG